MGNELGDRRRWNRWVHHHDIREADDSRDRRNVADEIEIELVVKRCVDRAWRAGEDQRISVGGRAHDRLDAEIAAGAWPILDDEWLTKPLRQPLPDQARD